MHISPYISIRIQDHPWCLTIPHAHRCCTCNRCQVFMAISRPGWTKTIKKFSKQRPDQLWVVGVCWNYRKGLIGSADIVDNTSWIQSNFLTNAKQSKDSEVMAKPEEIVFGFFLRIRELVSLLAHSSFSSVHAIAHQISGA